jgi:hypothetical protein
MDASQALKEDVKEQNQIGWEPFFGAGYQRNGLKLQHRNNSVSPEEHASIGDMGETNFSDHMESSHQIMEGKEQ